MIPLSPDMKASIDPIPSGRATPSSGAGEGGDGAVDAALPRFADLVEQGRIPARRDTMAGFANESGDAQGDPAAGAVALDPRLMDAKTVPRASSLAMSAAWHSMAASEGDTKAVFAEQPLPDPEIRGIAGRSPVAGAAPVAQVPVDAAIDGVSIENDPESSAPLRQARSDMADGMDMRPAGPDRPKRGESAGLPPAVATTAPDRPAPPPEMGVPRPQAEASDALRGAVSLESINPAIAPEMTEMRTVRSVDTPSEMPLRAGEDVTGDAVVQKTEVRPARSGDAAPDVPIRADSDTAANVRPVPDAAAQKADIRTAHPGKESAGIPLSVESDTATVTSPAVPGAEAQRADIRPARSDDASPEMPRRMSSDAAPIDMKTPDTESVQVDRRTPRPENDPEGVRARPAGAATPVDPVPMATEQRPAGQRDDAIALREPDQRRMETATVTPTTATAKPASSDAPATEIRNTGIRNTEIPNAPTAQSTVEFGRPLSGKTPVVDGEIIASDAPRRDGAPLRTAPETAPPVMPAQHATVRAASGEAVDSPVRQNRPVRQGIVREMDSSMPIAAGPADLGETILGTGAPAAPPVTAPPTITTAIPTLNPAVPGAPIPFIAVPEAVGRDAAPELVLDPDTGLIARVSESSADLRASAPTIPRLVTADGADVMQEIVRATLVSKGPTTIELSLDPGELGKLDIEMSFKDDRVSILIRGDRDESLDLMRRSQDDLARMLRQAGLDLDTLNFSQGRSGQQEQGNRFLTLATDALIDGEDGAMQAGAPVARASTRLDIRI